MFDANARYIPKGVKFFASGSVLEGDQLHKLGLRSGEPVLCKMLDKGNRNPRISVKIKGKIYIVRSWAKGNYSFLTYEGCPNGNGFICDKSKAACEKLIGGFNNTYWRRR